MSTPLDQDSAHAPTGAGRPMRRGPPRGPLIIMLVVVAVVGAMALWVYLTPPKPLPEIPPHKQIPADWHHPQDPRPDRDPAKRPFEP